jgi:formate dehydrogenase maturation protein FdhE
MPVARLAACPFCGSREVELISSFGGQIITSQLRCRSCNSYFEALRQEFEPEPHG